MAANPIEKDAMEGPGSIDILAQGRSAHGGTRPRHRRVTETVVDTV